MITELYEKLTETVSKVMDGGLFQHIDMWNQNVEFIEEDEAWNRPALFVEFGEIIWDPLKGPRDVMQGKGELLLHIVTDWKGSAAAGSRSREDTLIDYDIPVLLQKSIVGLEGETFRILSLSRSLTNHNHQELLENIDIYRVVYQRPLF